MSWILGIVALALLLDALRTRGRAALLPLLLPADDERAPTRDGALVVRDGVTVPAAVERAARAHAAAAGLRVVDLVPVDLPTDEAIALLRRVDPLRYRHEPTVTGATALHAAFASDTLRAHAGVVDGERPAPPRFLRLAKALAEHAADDKGLAVAPGLAATPLDPAHARALAREQGEGGNRVLTTMRALFVTLLVAGVVVAPLSGALALIAWHLAPALAVGPPLRPRDRWRAALLRLPREVGAWWRLLSGAPGGSLSGARPPAPTRPVPAPRGAAPGASAPDVAAGRYERVLSPVERIWLVADRMCPPFVNQLVLEGEDTPEAPSFDEAAWREAVAAAAAVNPGARIALEGSLGRSRWVDTGVAPPVQVVDGSGWDGCGPDGAPFLAEPLSPHEGPTTAVLLVTGTPPRVVARTHHATMDGRGTLTFVDDVFRALRGEPLVGCAGPLAAIDDMTLARAYDGGVADRRKEDCLAPTGLPEGSAPGVRWRRVTLPGAPRRLLPRLACALGAEARRHGSGRVRFDVPVDLRARRPDIRSTANLTGMLFPEVASDESPEEVAVTLGRLLDERREAAIDPALPAIRSAGLGLMTFIGKSGVRRVHRRGRYVATAVLSNLGRLDLTPYRGGGFQARTAFFIPPGTDSTACFLSLTGHADGVELCATVPRVLATGERLERLLAALLRRLA